MMRRCHVKQPNPITWTWSRRESRVVDLRREEFLFFYFSLIVVFYLLSLDI